ncbi:MAG: DUF4386 domain-containing protein [Anaerolineae bacterium]|jgi:hypothetical protein
MATGASAKSVNKIARIAGVLYLVIAVVGGLAFTAATSNLIVPGDATATANNIMASESLFRIGAVGDSVVCLAEIVLVVTLYVLFKPVSKTLNLVATFSRLAMTVMQGMNLLNKLTALQLLSGAGYLTAFEPDKLHALVLESLKAYEYGALIWGTFFGLHLLVLGYLLLKSGYFPRALGVLFVLASLGYLVDSYGHFLLPQYTEIYSWVVWATVPAELSFALWLLIKGVNVEEWERRALESA